MQSYISFKELLEQPVQSIVSDDDDVEDYLSIQIGELVDFPRNFKNNEAIKIHIFEDFCYDGRRVWQLFYVTFKDKIVMACYAAGREGQDSYSARVFDLEAFSEMVMFIAEQRDFYDIEKLKHDELNKIRKKIAAIDIPTGFDESANDFINFYSNKFNDVFSNW
jgi:hypothetical protein